MVSTERGKFKILKPTYLKMYDTTVQVQKNSKNG